MDDYCNSLQGLYYEYKGCNLLYSTNPLSLIREIEDAPFSEDDVVVVTYPKSGTTWVQEILRLISAKGDIENASAEQLSQTVVNIDFQKGETSNLDKIKTRHHPWHMKSHLPVVIHEKNVEAGKCKFIVVMRNPKDMLVSYYHYYKAWADVGCFSGTFQEFFDIFKAKSLMRGDWLDHVLGWWKYKDQHNVLVVKYEELKADTKEGVRKIAEFCDQQLTEEQLDVIVDHVSFNKMKVNPMVNQSLWPTSHYDVSIAPHIRKGEVGGWREFFSQEMDDYMEEHYITKAKQAGLDFFMG